MSSSQVPDRMQVDPPPTRQSRTSINYLLSPELPSIIKPQSQRPQPPLQDSSKPVKAPFQSNRCMNCGEWINTTDCDGNETGLWEIHVKKCARASPAPSDASSSSIVEDTTPFRRYKTRVNEEERLAMLRRDKQIEHIEEYQVLCAFCDSWVQLRKDRPYCSIAWTEHKLICRRKRQQSRKPSPKPPSTSKRPKREHTASSVVPVPPSENASTTTRSASAVPNSSSTSASFTPHHQSSIPPPTLPPSLSSAASNTNHHHHHPRRSDPGNGGRTRANPPPDSYVITSPPQIRRTESERVKLLVSDPNATTVEPHRVLCAVCGRWIQLRKNSTYCTAPWIQHVSKCVKRNGQNSTRSARRHSAGVMAQATRQATPSLSRASVEHQPTDRDEELESDPDLEAEDLPHSSSRRPRGRPRKRRIGQINPPPQQGQTTALGRRSISPIPTPSPPPEHPYPGHRYVYISTPPISTLFDYYAHSQHNTTDDSYAMYFDAEAIPTSVLSKLTLPPFPEGEGQRWIVWELQDYGKNGCPIGRTMSTIPAGAVARTSEDGGESGERNPESMHHGRDTVNAGENRVNTPTDLPSVRNGHWSRAAVKEDSPPPHEQQRAVRRSPSLVHENSFPHSDRDSQQQNNNNNRHSQTTTPHRPAMPVYESPTLPREPYRSPHMDLPSPASKSVPSVPIHSPTPHRQIYYPGKEEESGLIPRETKMYRSPPPPPPPPPPLPPVYPKFSPTVAPSDAYPTSQIHLPPPPPPPAPVSYPVREPYHASPVMPHIRERDYHSPRHPPIAVPTSTYHSPPPPLSFHQTPPPSHRFREEPPPQPTPRYDTPGSSVHHSTPGMNYRSPNMGERQDRRSSFQTSSKKRLRDSRSRSRSRSRSGSRGGGRNGRSRSRSRSRSLIQGTPVRPIPTAMARVVPEARLHYTHRCIAHLFQTSHKGAVDIPLMNLMTFMNDGFEPHDARTSHFTFEEVTDYVSELGRRQMLIFTKEGGVQLGEI